jgi:hypothetical protein
MGWYAVASTVRVMIQGEYFSLVSQHPCVAQSKQTGLMLKPPIVGISRHESHASR